MADSLCGPSNALQNFQKHSTVDRTLQQDRLISRQSPSQGFRSSPGPNAGFLDPEFEAFQAGQSPLQQLESQNFQQHQGFSHVSQKLGQAGPSAWANDFHRLSISSPPPQFQQSPLGQQSQQRLDTGGWHQDFANQQNQIPEQAMPQFHGQNTSTYRFSPMSAMNTHPMFAGSFANTQAEQSIPQQLQQPEAFDEEAFARAFEEASRTEADVAQDVTKQQDPELGQDIMINESAELLMESEPVLDHRLGADLIHDPARENKELQEQNDPDALARTAAQLLDSVSNNQTDKFQNSQFLELMRQFRDREVSVEGDKIVGTMADSQSQIKNEILTLSRTLKKWALDRDRPLRGSDGARQRGIIESLLGLIPLYSKLLQTTDGALIIQESRIQRTLAGMAENPAVHELPDIHSQVLISLSLFNQLAQAPTSTQEHEAIQQRALQQDSQLRRIQESWERQASAQRPEAEIETLE